ncbi:unnamed protein product [Pleuronectes platessa]|uniref:Uncharacterized protein n=1 Tax=Pleuronectes platessa TaxID=8262 RepID=A0A9N7VMP0_PLEPL|nr:unnamed protein product [Pleuronectes platessa]
MAPKEPDPAVYDGDAASRRISLNSRHLLDKSYRLYETESHFPVSGRRAHRRGRLLFDNTRLNHCGYTIGEETEYTIIIITTAATRPYSGLSETICDRKQCTRELQIPAGQL